MNLSTGVETRCVGMRRIQREKNCVFYRRRKMPLPQNRDAPGSFARMAREVNAIESMENKSKEMSTQAHLQALSLRQLPTKRGRLNP